MKIEKLTPPVMDYMIVDKVNEIIDLLNNSFITQDKNVAILDNLSTAVGKPSPVLNGTSDVSFGIANSACTDLLDIAFKTADSHCRVATLQKIEDNNIAEPKCLFDDIKCPHCGARYFTISETYTTAVYYPPIYKDGVNINPDQNKSTTKYHCLHCDKYWKE